MQVQGLITKTSGITCKQSCRFGIDSAGNTCGQRNSWNGTDGPDLRNYKKLYYLDPLQLLDSNTFLGARSICVESCPGAESVCSLGSPPCRNSTQYR